MERFDYRKGLRSLEGLTDDQALASLDRPTIFHVEGEDPHGPILISTLIHGCEPAGFRALLREAREWGYTPSYTADVYFMVGSVQAAKTPGPKGEYFFHRDLPGAPSPGAHDFNRMWGNKEPQSDLEKTAAEIKEFLDTIPFNAFLDIHSYMSRVIEPHACIPHLCEETIDYTRTLASRAFLIDFGLGTLLEHMGKRQIPSVLIEAGVNNSPQADDYASKAMHRFFQRTDVIPGGDHPEICKHWYRDGIQFKIKPNVSVAIAENRESGKDLTLRKDIEMLNHTLLPQGTSFGWGDSLGCITTNDSKGRKVEEYFFVEDGEIKIRKALVPNFLNAHEERMKGGGFYFFEEFNPDV